MDGILNLRHATLSERNSREVVLAAVVRTGAALQWASDELKQDTGIVMAAVQRDGMALHLQYADERPAHISNFEMNKLYN